MSPRLTFVIPVRHPRNAENWARSTAILSDTVRSIAAQDCDEWSAVVVVNEEAELPPLPDKVAIKRVGFPPLSIDSSIEKERLKLLFKFDKGRKLLAGMLHARDARYFMTVDDDDFVSRRLASFVARHDGANGWIVTDGFTWPSGGGIVYRTAQFQTKCATCHVIRADLYGLPEREEDATEAYITTHLTRHKPIGDVFRAKGAPLEPLPFPGAVYRVGHPGTNSERYGRRGMLERRKTLKDPLKLMATLASIRPVTPAFRREFGLPS